MAQAGKQGAKADNSTAREGVFHIPARIGSTGARGIEMRPTSTGSKRLGFHNKGGHVDLRVPFFTQLVTGLYDGCYATGNSLVLHTHKPDASPQRIYDTLVASGMAGLIVKMLASDPLLPLLTQAPFPVVAVVDALPDLPSVVSDDICGARAIAAHLASKGHSRVFFQCSDVPHTSVRRRLAAMQAEGNLGNLHIDVGNVPDGEPGGICHGLKEALQRPRKERPTVVVCWDDRNALSVITQCRAMGLRVPGDLAVVGYDDGVGEGNLVMDNRRLTTVRAEWGRWHGKRCTVWSRFWTGASCRRRPFCHAAC